MRVLSALVVVFFTLACGGLPAGSPDLVGTNAAPANTASTIVTVLYFDNNTNDPAFDVFGKGLADMMITDLSKVEDLAVVERAKLQALIDEMSLQQSDYFDPATAQKLGQGLGATHAITGSISAFAPQIRIDIRLIDVNSSEIVLADKVTGSDQDLFGLQEQLANTFAEALDKKRDAESSGEGLGADSLLEYSKGLEAADQGDLEAASALLNQVVKSAPSFGLAKQRLTDVDERLAESRKRREGMLNAGQQALLVNIDKELSKNAGSLSRDQWGRYYAYRNVRGGLFLEAANKMLQEPPKMEDMDMAMLLKMRNDPDMMLRKTFKEEDHAVVRELLRMWFDNTMVLRKELAAYEASGKRLPSFPKLDPEDARRAKALGVNTSNWVGDANSVAVTLARVAVLGRLPDAFVGSRPSLAELDSTVVPPILALFQLAYDDFEKGDEGKIDLLDAHGDAMMALGQEEQAIALWQQILDEFPTTVVYDQIEAKIKKHS